jgi:ATP-dependent RNA helicase DeaD
LTTYLPAINSVLEDLSEELIKKVSVEFNRFINYYKKLEIFLINWRKDVNVMIRWCSRENNNGGATRYFVNIGSRDNFDWMSLKIT